MKNFKELGVDESFIKALHENNISLPTDIQLEVIPLLLSKKCDLIAQAQTGSGKTAAFGIPLLHQVDPAEKKVQALVLSPTRELSQQIAKQLFRFTKYGPKIFTEAVYGGASIQDQMKALSRPTQIIVATPGRLLDLYQRKAVDFSHVKTVVLDEADEMLSMGFKKELDLILSSIAGTKNTWLFSATMPEGLKHIVRKYMAPSAAKVHIDKTNVVNKNIGHHYIVCKDSEKTVALIQFLNSQGEKRGIIFCNTKSGAQTLTQELLSQDFKTESIHGDLQQKERDKVMRAFKNKKLQFLIATDIAARGIDIENIAFVIHYQIPEKYEYYTHRSGRTARAGKNGISIAFINAEELKSINKMEGALNIKFRPLK